MRESRSQKDVKRDPIDAIAQVHMLADYGRGFAGTEKTNVE
jgi:hypothetical protein